MGVIDNWPSILAVPTRLCNQPTTACSTAAFDTEKSLCGSVVLTCIVQGSTVIHSYSFMHLSSMEWKLKKKLVAHCRLIWSPCFLDGGWFTLMCVNQLLDMCFLSRKSVGPYENSVHIFAYISKLYLRFTMYSITCLVTVMSICFATPLSMGFPRQEYWSWFPFASPGDLPDPRIEPTSPALAGGFLALSP